MSLENELKLRKPIALLPHKALLSVYYTTSCLKKKADEFFRPFGLTDVQFNALMMLQHQGGAEKGLSQTQLSDMMLVNRANITTLVDRMEKADLVKRTAAKSDRRRNIIKLTTKAKKLLAKVEPLYAQQVIKAMSLLKKGDQNKLISMLDKVRSELSR
jgi:DNA-binding MarR family transcriptional regulator